MPLLVLLLVGIWVYALVESITAEETSVRNLPKVAWVFIVLLAFPVGAIVWFIAGRPKGAKLPILDSESRGLSSKPQHPIGPEDTSEFRRNSEDQKRLRKWEDDLAKREEELRHREGEDRA